MRRNAAARSQGGGMAPPWMASGGAPDPKLQAQIRQRMLERMQENFAGFTRLLDEQQRRKWDAALASSLSATRTTIYRLANGRREAVPVRVGASDGTSTEISGDIREGDEIITGERAPK